MGVKRIKSEEIKEFYRARPCDACRRPPRSDAAHIRSVGAGGEDTHENMLSMCREHHSLQHAEGWVYMFTHFPRLAVELKNKGWDVYLVGDQEKLLYDLR